MLRNIFLKSLRDQWRALVWWTLGVAVFAVYTVSFYPTIRDNADQFIRIFEELPEGLTSFLGRGGADLVTPAGYLQQQLFQLTAPLLFLIFGIRIGARAIAGEERVGTLDLLLSTPVPRWRVVVDKFAAMAAATAVLGLGLWATLVGTAPLFQIDVGAVRLGEATVSTALLGLVFGALALAVGSATGSRGVAVGVATALALAAYSINALSALVPALETPALFSPFHYYGAAVPLMNGLDPGHVAVLVGLTAALTVGAVVAFARRDLAV
jgi:ABC-2 type transport system permease protein